MSDEKNRAPGPEVKPGQVVISKAEYDALLKARAERDIAQSELRMSPGGIVLNARPKDENGNPIDLETEGRLNCEREGKKYPAVTVDPETGRVTQTERIEKHQQFIENEAERRARAAALAGALR